MATRWETMPSITHFVAVKMATHVEVEWGQKGLYKELSYCKVSIRVMEFVELTPQFSVQKQ